MNDEYIKIGGKMYNVNMMNANERKKMEKRKNKLEKTKERNKKKARALKDSGILNINGVLLIYDYKIIFDGIVYYIVADSFVSKKNKIRTFLRECVGCKNTVFTDFKEYCFNVCGLLYCLKHYNDKNIIYIYENIYENDFNNIDNKYTDLD